MKQRVVVGMSGGVDSSVAAYLLREQGYEVIGVTMRLWQENGEPAGQAGGSCDSGIAVRDAKKVAEQLGIQYHVLDFRSEFEEGVIKYFISEYRRGYTPNPCNICNRRIKWEALLSCALELGADVIATGHYARVERLPNGRYTVCNSASAEKDQTYALCMLTQEQLGRTLMPVGALTKEEVRRLAGRAGLLVAQKADSQDICFIPDRDYAGFIGRETGDVGEPGNFVDENGTVLGMHHGIIHYTVGQRKGLGISAPTPLFVKELCPERNEVVLCRSEHLFADTCYVSGINYMGIGSLDGKREAVGKIRYSHGGSGCTIEPCVNGWLKCTFSEPQRAITPGQSAVFYEDGHILCAGTIERTDGVHLPPLL